MKKALVFRICCMFLAACLIGCIELPTSMAKQVTEQTQQVGARNGWDRDFNYYYVNGRPVTGVKYIRGKLYYFRDNGRVCKFVGQRLINGKNYYFRRDYSLATGVIRVGNKYYYFQRKDGSAYRGTGVRNLEGNMYNFGPGGALKCGWYHTAYNDYYISPKTYTIVKGWNYVDGYRFYFDRYGRWQQDVRPLVKNYANGDYIVKVNRNASCVTVYAKDKPTGEYIIPVVAFVCSAGYGTPTGTFTTGAKLRWHELMGPCWGQWCTKITPDILFHSVFYDRPYDNKSLNVNAYNKLGTIASHGCVRLTAGDAKWIYDECNNGFKVIIYDNADDPGPFDKPTAQKLSPGHTWDPTDPAFQ